MVVDEKDVHIKTGIAGKGLYESTAIYADAIIIEVKGERIYRQETVDWERLLFHCGWSHE